LGNGLDSVNGSVVQGMQWCLGIKKQRGSSVAIAGERLEAGVEMRGWIFAGWIGMDCFHHYCSKEEMDLPSAFLRARVAAMHGVGISRPLEQNSTTPKHARA
jgi:hypothetical protein